MTSERRHHLHAMSMSASPSAGSARGCCAEPSCMAPTTLRDMRLIGNAAGAVHMRRHTGAAYIPAAIGTPLAESP